MALSSEEVTYPAHEGHRVEYNKGASAGRIVMELFLHWSLVEIPDGGRVGPEKKFRVFDCIIT